MGDVINMKTKKPEDTEPLPKIPRRRIDYLDIVGVFTLFVLGSVITTGLISLVV